MKNDYPEYMVILETHNPGDIAFIKSILTSESIDHYIQGESVAPYLFNALPMRVYVRNDHCEKAKEILQDVKISFSYNIDD